MPLMSVAKGTVLVTGGAGFIGSHTVVLLAEAGFEVIILDNFSNSHPGVLNRLKRITGRDITCIKGDLLDREGLQRLFEQHDIDAVIHFAGLKSVTQSVKEPGLYYLHNVQGSLNLLQAMQAHGCFRMVFSSSAAVYGDSEEVPVYEHAPARPKSPYGRSKQMVEMMLEDLVRSDCRWQVSILRYFNPAGAHPSGLIGESPRGEALNLLPTIARVAAGEMEALLVYGDDYSTRDGTGVRGLYSRNGSGRRPYQGSATAEPWMRGI